MAKRPIAGLDRTGSREGGAPAAMFKDVLRF
jgi:hypothetical protein